MLDRVITPGQMHIVREVVEDDGAGDTDIAVFNDVRANYTITSNPDGSIRVEHVTVSLVVDPATGRNLVSDGADTLRNIEVLRFLGPGRGSHATCASARCVRRSALSGYVHRAIVFELQRHNALDDELD